MHELSLINGLLEIVRTYETTHGYERVNALKLSFGRLSGIDAGALQFAFEIQSQGTKAEGAVLEFDILPSTVYCVSCSQDFVIETYDGVCPRCADAGVVLTGGTESLQLIEMDVD